MLPETIWMDLEMIILSEVSQTERQILYDIIYMWNLKCDISSVQSSHSVMSDMTFLHT